MNFKDKVCVVTGGANGIGRCIVEEFLRTGAKVAFIDTDITAGERLAAQYNSDSILFAAGDITEEIVLTQFAQNVLCRFEHVDYLVNNACITRKGILSACDYDNFNYVLKLGVTAPYYLTKLFLNAFSQGASVINISSTRAFMSQADTESYTAAKGGISALTHALAVSLSGKVRANSISPGWIDTGGYQQQGDFVAEDTAADKAQHPAGRVGTPMDIAKTVQFLCSDDAAFITGENIVVDGGMTKLMIYHNDHGWSYNP